MKQFFHELKQNLTKDFFNKHLIGENNEKSISYKHCS